MMLTQVKSALAVLGNTLPDLKPVKVEYVDAPSATDAIGGSYHYSDESKSRQTGH